MTTTTVMLSGGPDSALALHHELQKEGKVQALVFDFGQQSAAAETAAARRQAAARGVSLEVIDISGLRRSFLGLAPELVIGLGFTDPVGRGVANCPHALFGLATSFAILTGSDRVVVGMHGDDHSDPSAVAKYLADYSAGIAALHRVPFELAAPFLQRSKQEIIADAAAHGLDLASTWSCSRGHHEHCGACKECKSRKAAFAAAGVQDSTVYAV